MWPAHSGSVVLAGGAASNAEPIYVVLQQEQQAQQAGTRAHAPLQAGTTLQLVQQHQQHLQAGGAAHHGAPSQQLVLAHVQPHQQGPTAALLPPQQIALTTVAALQQQHPNEQQHLAVTVPQHVHIAQEPRYVLIPAPPPEHPQHVVVQLPPPQQVHLAPHSQALQASTTTALLLAEQSIPSQQQERRQEHSVEEPRAGTKRQSSLVPAASQVLRRTSQELAASVPALASLTDLDALPACTASGRRKCTTERNRDKVLALEGLAASTTATMQVRWRASDRRGLHCARSCV